MSGLIATNRLTAERLPVNNQLGNRLSKLYSKAIALIFYPHYIDYFLTYTSVIVSV